MTRDSLIEEIRRAQATIRRTGSAAAHRPAPGDPDGTRAAIAQLFARLESTQEQLLRTIHERTSATPARTSSPTNSTTGTEPNALFREVLARLERGNPALEERLARLESRIETWAQGTGSSARHLEPILDRLDVIEHRLRNAPAAAAAPEIDLGPLREEIQALGTTIGNGTAGTEIGPEAFAPICEKLDAIEERLGGDAGAMTIGASIARLHESLERIEGTVAGAGGGAGLDPELVARLEAAIDGFPTGGSVSGAENGTDGGDDASTKALSTLKRDFSLLVHTINGHLQESRHRSEKVEASLEAIHRSLAPIAREIGVEIEVPAETEGEPA